MQGKPTVHGRPPPMQSVQGRPPAGYEQASVHGSDGGGVGGVVDQLVERLAVDVALDAALAGDRRTPPQKECICDVDFAERGARRRQINDAGASEASALRGGQRRERSYDIASMTSRNGILIIIARAIALRLRRLP